MFKKKRIMPLLCALLIMLTLVMPAIPAQAADTAIIKAGTYRFTDVPSVPSAAISQSMIFSIAVVGYTANCSSIGVEAYDANISFYFESADDVLENTLAIYGVALPCELTVYNARDNVWNWGVDTKTIIIPTNSEVSIEFYVWFTANAVEVVSPVTPGLSPGGAGDFVAVLDVFDFVGGWMSGAVAEVSSIFYADGQLTFIGEVSIACVCISFALLVLFLISKWLHFK